MNQETIDFYEIYGYYYQPIWQMPYFKLIIVTLIFLIFGLGIWFLARFLKNRKIKKLLPWQWALQELEKLDLSGCNTKQDYKKFYFKLTFIIKKYLEKRFDWQTEDKTDEELVVFLKDKKFDESFLRNISELFQGALMVKFAGQDVLRIQANKDLKMMFDFVKSSIPEEQKYKLS